MSHGLRIGALVLGAVAVVWEIPWLTRSDLGRVLVVLGAAICLLAVADLLEGMGRRPAGD